MVNDALPQHAPAKRNGTYALRAWRMEEPHVWHRALVVFTLLRMQRGENTARHVKVPLVDVLAGDLQNAQNAPMATS